MGLWKFQSQVFSEELFIFGVDLMKGDIESRHDSGFMVRSWDEIEFCIVELEVDEVVDIGSAMVSQKVQLIEMGGICLKLIVFDFGRDKVDVVAPEVAVAPE